MSGLGGVGGTGGLAGSASSSGGTNPTGGTTAEPLQCANSDALQAISISAGAKYTCALMSNSGVRCWGHNDKGQLGDGTTTDRSTLPTSDALTGVQAVAAGTNRTCALMQSGGVRCWGYDYSYQSTSTPSASDLLTGVKAIAVGVSHTCALMQTGGVRCFGFNYNGELGDGTTANTTTPSASDVLTGVKDIATGSHHTCALMESGSVRCWGDDQAGQVGTSSPSCNLEVSGRTGETLSSTNCQLTPIEVLTGARAISAGGDHTCALMETGGVRCWGGGFSTTSDIPASVRAISVASNHVCALTESGAVQCWGNNGYGQLNHPRDCFRYHGRHCSRDRRGCYLRNPQ